MSRAAYARLSCMLVMVRFSGDGAFDLELDIVLGIGPDGTIL